MTFEEWAKTKSDDLYEEIEFLLSEGAMTGDDIYMGLQKAYEAGWNACADLYDEPDYSETEYNLGLNDES